MCILWDPIEFDVKDRDFRFYLRASLEMNVQGGYGLPKLCLVREGLGSACKNCGGLLVYLTGMIRLSRGHETTEVQYNKDVTASQQQQQHELLFHPTFI